MSPAYSSWTLTKKCSQAVHILTAGKAYRFQDVSAAAYQAFRKEHSSQEEPLAEICVPAGGKRAD